MCLPGHPSASQLFCLILTLEFGFRDEEEGLLFQGGCRVPGLHSSVRGVDSIGEVIEGTGRLSHLSKVTKDTG